MTREQAGELAKILQAFSKSKPLQYTRDVKLNTWLDYDYDNDTDVLYSIVNMGIEFRIKPERKKEPLTMQDLIDRELSDKTISLKFDNARVVIHISKYDESEIIFSSGVKIDYEFLKNNYKFLDDTPCYKEVECE